MTERINHAVEARKLLGRSIQMSEPDNAEIGADIAALTHATLALVEQQKIANLIALGDFTRVAPVSQVVSDAREVLTVYCPHDDEERGGWRELRPEVAEVLGL